MFYKVSSSLFFEFLVLYTFSTISCSRGNLYCNDTVVNVSACLNQPCHLSSLESLMIPDNFDWNTTLRIKLCTEISELNSAVSFSNLQVEIGSSRETWSEVQCTGNNSGVKFTGVSIVELENLVFRNCGIVLTGRWFQMASIIISNSANVMINNVDFMSSKDFGIALDNVGRSIISNCTFDNHEHETMASRGILLEIRQNNTYHYIRECSFFSNGATDNLASSNCSNTVSAKAITGAGLLLLFQNNSNSNIVEVSDCMFEQNFAQEGGALYLGIQHSSNNSIVIQRSEFKNNAAKSRGGAIAVEFIFQHQGPSQKNTVKIEGCTFEKNTASMGGSVHLSTTFACNAHNNTVEFENTMWTENSAFLGAAVMFHTEMESRQTRVHFTTHDSLSISMKDCKFEHNTVDEGVNMKATEGQSSGGGTIRVTEGMKLEILGKLVMAHGTGSALYLESSAVEFKPGSEIILQGNTAKQGGAIALMGARSVMNVHKNSSILLRDNKAEYRGGAIYQEFSKQCFLANKGEEEDMKSRLEFRNNSAGSYGHSVYTNSLRPCFVDAPPYNQLNFFPGHFNIAFCEHRQHEVSTLGSKILVSLEETDLSPGQETDLSLYVKDDTGSNIHHVFKTFTSEESFMISHISTESGSTLQTGSNKIRFLGKPKSSAILLISTIYQTNLEVNLSIQLSECPPGYLYDSVHRLCMCSANSVNSEDRYIGIENCNPHSFQARLQYGHWAGYLSKDTSNNSNNSIGENDFAFLTGYCPRGFCASINQNKSDITLPSRAPPSPGDMSEVVCKEGREGILCGRCVANHSTSFVSFRDCIPNSKCRLGWLYYILSQIVPITIVFTVVTVFDINLTSGMVSGALFYAQLFNNLLISGNNAIWFDKHTFRMLKGMRILSNVFNLIFFTSDKFAFCLWEGIGLLDVAAFNYVTLLYSLLLVVLTAKVFIPCIQKCKRKYTNATAKLQVFYSSKSTIHGLVSFLILCYSPTTLTSLYIMSQAELYGKGGQRYNSRVFFNGDLEFFKGKHLLYVIPAIFFFFFITVVPAILLLAYPLCYRVMALCRLQESRFARLLCKAIPLEKYKPLFDSFQNTFKDKHRYFAGLYFIYRLVLISTIFYSRELRNYYLLLEVELIAMLALNAYIQPYKSKWHNRVDTSIFLLMALLNTITIFHYNKRSQYPMGARLGPLQMILAYLPFFYLLGYVVVRGVVAAKGRFKKHLKSYDEEENEIALSSLSRLNSSYRESEYRIFPEISSSL